MTMHPGNIIVAHTAIHDDKVTDKVDKLCYAARRPF